MDDGRDVKTATSANAERWSAEDDAWRGYKRTPDGGLELDHRVQQTLALVQPRPGASYVDVGCASGVLTRLFAARIGAGRVVGVDFVDLSPGFEFHTVNLDASPTLPLPSESFDVITCLETLEHVHDTDRLVRELRRVLKPDGYAILSVPRLDGLLAIAMLAAGMQPPAVECSLRKRYGAPGEPERVSGHVSHFTRRALASLLHANGFAIDAFSQASIYKGWLMAQESPSSAMKAPLWLLSKVPFKQDVLIVRIVPTRP